MSETENFIEYVHRIEQENRDLKAIILRIKTVIKNMNRSASKLSLSAIIDEMENQS